MTAIRVAAVAVIILGLTYGFGQLQLGNEGFPAAAPDAESVRGATGLLPKGLSRIIINMTGLGTSGAGSPVSGGLDAGVAH